MYSSAYYYALFNNYVIRPVNKTVIIEKRFKLLFFIKSFLLSKVWNIVL